MNLIFWILGYNFAIFILLFELFNEIKRVNPDINKTHPSQILLSRQILETWRGKVSGVAPDTTR
jgi:hypothetical protein